MILAVRSAAPPSQPQKTRFFVRRYGLHIYHNIGLHVKINNFFSTCIILFLYMGYKLKSVINFSDAPKNK